MARALHTSALSSTPAFIDQLLTLQAIPTPTTEQEYWALVGRVCGRLRASYPDRVLAQAVAPSSGQNGAERPQQEVPADDRELVAPSVPDPDSLPF